MKENILDWIKEKQNYLFYGFLALAVALFFGIKNFSPKKQSANLINIERAYSHWEKTGENLEELSTALKHHPELETKFGSLIADRFILQGNGEGARAFADSVLQRISQYVPQHSAYAKESVHIAENNLKEALKGSLQLKEQLATHSLLYGFNLLRIATLSHELNEKEEELASLIDLEKFIQNNSENGQIFLQCFSSEHASLQDFIEYRKKQIN